MRTSTTLHPHPQRSGRTLGLFLCPIRTLPMGAPNPRPQPHPPHTRTRTRSTRARAYAAQTLTAEVGPVRAPSPTLMYAGAGRPRRMGRDCAGDPHQDREGSPPLLSAAPLLRPPFALSEAEIDSSSRPPGFGIEAT
ncbi:hypothetical protein B0H11DRAFT_2229533 [Mycena galericulata]|nr:hypothetical protein B0H11DRAFT_2229533 [Mycena galericulata]